MLEVATNTAELIKDVVRKDRDFSLVLGGSLSVQNTRYKLLCFPILESATIDTGLLAHFKRIGLAVGDALLLAGVRQSSIHSFKASLTFERNRLEYVLGSWRHKCYLR